MSYVLQKHTLGLCIIPKPNQGLLIRLNELQEIL